MSTINAIVLSLQPHSDKAHILHAYTREHGRVNYMVYGVGPTLKRVEHRDMPTRSEIDLPCKSVKYTLRCVKSASPVKYFLRKCK